MKSPTMTKETFVGIIKSIQEQREREEKFSEAITKAFVDAGDLEEFHESSSFNPPTGLFIDGILESLAKSFISEKQIFENAIDLINYFIYELEPMGYVFMEPIDPEKNTFEVAPVPAYYMSSTGKKVPLSTPEELYDALVYEMEKPGEHEYRKPNEHDMIHSVMPENTNKYHPEFNDVFNKLKKLVWDKLGVDEWEIKPSSEFTNDLGADSLDEVEIALDVEKEFGISITDYEWDTMCDGIRTMEDAVHAIIKKQSNK